MNLIPEHAHKEIFKSIIRRHTTYTQYELDAMSTFEIAVIADTITKALGG